MYDHIAQLHCHSSHSMKDGLAPVGDLVNRAAKLGQPGIGITEHGHLYSAPAFFKACKETGIKGVQGCEIYEAVPHTWDPDPAGPHHAAAKAKFDPNVSKYFHLTLWCLNLEGWINLCALHTQSFTRGYKPKNQPLIDRASLEKHNKGLMLGLGCPGSRVNQALARKGYSAAVEAARWCFEVFEDRVVVEVMSALPDQVRMLSDQRKLAKYFGCPTMGTNDVHYLKRADGILNGPHHALVMARKFGSSNTAAAESTDQSDESYGSWYGSDQFFLRTRQEMIQAGIFDHELDATIDLLNRVEFDFLSMPEPRPPVAKIPGIGEDLAFDRYLLG